MWNFPILPESASTLAPHMDRLLAFLLALTAFFSILIAALVLFMAIRYQAGAKVNRTSTATHTQFMMLEIGWTVIPLFIVMIIFVWGSLVFYRARQAPPNAIEMFVIGKQWMWKMQHPEGQREINQLHVPVGQPISLTMISEDVIHNFAVPAFRIKQDVVPGRYSTQWFEATKPGRYHIFCDQYCGTLHASMVGEVIAMPPQDYQKWLATGQTASATTSMNTSGAELFTSLACVTCHKNDSGGQGPSLVGVFGSRVTLNDGRTVTADEAYLRESILKPSAKVVRGYNAVMPTFEGQVSEQNILELITYIKSLKK